jgi:hypothetical protein
MARVRALSAAGPGYATSLRSASGTPYWADDSVMGGAASPARVSSTSVCSTIRETVQHHRV